MKRGPQWEQWEDDVIARLYPVEGWRGVKRELTHRTRGALSSRANKLGIQGAGEVFASAWGIEKARHLFAAVAEGGR